MDIELQEVTKKYRLPSGEFHTVIEKASLQVNSGEFIAIVGPSGSGKTTLLSMLGILTAPTEGKVIFDGQEINPGAGDEYLSYIRGSQLGFVFQFPSLHPTLTALENVLLPYAFGGRGQGGEVEWGMELLGRVGLAHKASAYPFQLSGGEQRRIALARGVVRNPSVILADEPTGALDNKSALVILEFLRELQGQGKTVIMVTHDLALVDGVTSIITVQEGLVSGNRP